jgi:hypothetical protein
LDKVLVHPFLADPQAQSAAVVGAQLAAQRSTSSTQPSSFSKPRMKTMMTGDSKEELQLAVGGATTTQR